MQDPVRGMVVPLSRRQMLQASLALPVALGCAVAQAQAHAEVAQALRRGGVVMAFRHALAPGTFDPPAFKLGDCSTQRNLNDDGRAQAQRIGAWFQQQGLTPTQVRSSPWCRCMDTARLAFGKAQVWDALGSPYGSSETTNLRSLAQLRGALTAASRKPAQFEVWVTHMFVLADLTQTSVSSGEGLVLQSGPNGEPRVLARLALA